MRTQRSSNGASIPLCPRCGQPLMHIVVLYEGSVDRCPGCGYERQANTSPDRTARTPLWERSPGEALAYIRELRFLLQEKQRRERAYLDGRARRKISTGTDEAYERDQELEDALLALLDDVEQATRTCEEEHDGEEIP